MAKYFFSTMVSRPMKLSGFTIKFEVCSVSGGRASGIYEATDPGEIAVLDDAVRGKRGVQELTPERYEELKKKQPPTRSPLNSGGSPRIVRPSITMDGNPAAPSAANPKPKPTENALTDREIRQNATPSIANLLRVKRLTPPKPFAAADAKTVKASKRADRAKIRVAREAVTGNR